MAKPKVNLTKEDIEKMPWKPVPEAPGIYEKILSMDPVTGSHTRLLKGDPGSAGKDVIIHDFWEEVYLLEGSYWNGDEYQEAGMYTCKPPGIKHGPFRTEEGYIGYEMRYYLYTLPEKK